MINIIYNFLPFAIYFLIFVYTVKKFPYFFILFFYLFMQQIKNILSNYYININAPVFMREVEKYSHNDASLLILVIIYCVFFLSLFLIYNKKFKKKFLDLRSKKVLFNSKLFARFFILSNLFIVVVLIIHILAKNTPLFYPDINKNNYWTDYALIPQIKFISSQLSTLLFINGYFFAQQVFFKKIYINKKVYIFILFLSIFYYILMKQKFGGPLLMLFSFFLPYLLFGLFYKKIKAKKILIIFISFVIVLSFTVYSYFYILFGNDALKMILERVFSLQSEMWEVTYIYLTNHQLPFDNNEFIRELSILFGFEKGYTGMQYVMSKVMEPDYFNFFIDIKINLSSAFPAYLFYLFEDPYLEFPFILLVSFMLYSLYTYLGFKVFQKLLESKPIISALYLKLMMSFMALIGQVYLKFVFNIKILVFIILILLIESRKKRSQ